MSVTVIISLLILIFFTVVIGKVILDIRLGFKEPRTIYAGDLRLVYRQVEPFFRQSHYYAKGARIGFGKDQENISLQYTLTLENGAFGGLVRLEEAPESHDRKRKPFHQAITKLVKTINDAIHNSQNCNIGAGISRWKAFEKTSYSGCQIELLQPVEDIAPFPGNRLLEVRLVYEKGQPQFVQGSQVGHQCGLSFGECWVDDFNYPVVSFNITLQPGESGSDAMIKSAMDYEPWATPAEVAYFRQQKPGVPDLIERLNQAIREQEEFNFSEYVQVWRQRDEHFEIMVISDEWIEYILSQQVEVQAQTPPEESQQPAPPAAYANRTSCVVMLAALALVGLMLFDVTSPLYIKQLTSFPAFAFVGLFILLAIAGISYTQKPKSK